MEHDRWDSARIARQRTVRLIIIAVVSLFGIVIGGLVTAACATTIVVPRDARDAVDQADVVVVGRVSRMATVTRGIPQAGGASVRTLVDVDVDEVKRGDVTDVVTLEEPGGVSMLSGGTAVVHGAPRYRVGDHVLVLARYNADGSLSTHLMEVGRIPVAPTLFGLGPMRATRDGDTELDTWKQSAADYALAMDDREVRPSTTPRYTLRSDELMMYGMSPATYEYRFMGGRWDAPANVVYDTAGDPALAATQTVNEMLDRAFQAWSRTAHVDFAPGGSSAAAGFTCSPGKLLVSFNDPKGEIGDPIGCSGVLAIGGFCADNPAPGETVGVIRAGALVFNNGWSTQCPQFWTMPLVEEIATHEAGHTIGLAHSCESGQACDTEREDATMFWMAHFDGRTSSLHAYDTGAALALYGPRETTAPSPTPTPAPTATSAPTPSPDATASAVPEPSPTATAAPTPAVGCNGKGQTARTSDFVFVAFVCGIVFTGGRRRKRGRTA